jgi:type I restriction enzyme S subunit
VIPEEWDVDSLGSCLTTEPDYGLNAPAVPHSDKLPAYIRITDITEDGRFLPEELVSVHNAASGSYYLRDGDIVFARTGASVGKSYRYDRMDGPLVFAGFLIRVHPDPRRLLPAFLAAFVTTGRYWNWVRQMSMRSGQPGINGKEYAQLPLPLPSVPEQRAIVRALGDVDGLIGALKKLIAKKRDLKQAAMQQLLSGQTRLPGFSGQWEVKRFSDIAAPRRDRVHPRGSGAPDFCVELEHIEPVTGQLIGSTSAAETSSLKSTFHAGDVLFGKLRAYLRKYWLADRPGVCSTEIWVLAPIARLVTAPYLFQIVKTDQFIDITSNAYGTHMPRSDWNIVKNYEVRLPRLPEQAAIGSVLSDMDAEIAILEQRRAKTRALKQGMMQELLTGRTRLV